MFMPKLTLAAFTTCAIQSSFAQNDTAPTMNIVETAVAAGNFNTLVKLVGLAGLEGILSSADAQLTTFAPTDDAFAKLDSATVTKLQEPVWKPQLTQLLATHVIAGGVFTSDMVVDGMEAATASGEGITLNTDPVRVNEISEVIVADIMATNGVIHAINFPILSQAVLTNIYDLIEETDDLSTLEFAVNKAGLVEALSGDGPITCLAPTNDAFDALPEGTVEGLLADIETLTKILLTHCFEGNIVSSMVTSGPITTLSGNTIEAVVTEEGAISFDGANVILADAVASNGIGHVIDKVIVPKSDEPAATTVAPTEAAAAPATTEAAKDDEDSMGKEESNEPSSAGKYGAAVAAAAVSAGFAMLI